MKTVEFFFDYSSPYSYLAATQMEGLAARTGASVLWRPFVLGAVFKAAGNTPPAAVAAKVPYLLKDLQRWASHYDVPFRFASRFPVNAIKALRLTLTAEAQGADKAASVALAAFRALWVEDRDITALPELHAIAAAAGLDAERALREIEDPAIKDRLREYTDGAIRRGAFGAPTFFVGDEMFWGDDRLQFVEAALSVATP